MADYHLVPLQEEHVLQLPLGKLVTLVQLALLHLPRPHQLLLLLQELTVQQGHLLLCVREPPHVRIMRFVQSLYKSSLPQYVLPKKEILHLSPIRFGTCATFSVALFTSSAPPLPLVLFLTFFFTIFVSSTFSHALCDLLPN